VACLGGTRGTRAHKLRLLSPPASLCPCHALSCLGRARGLPFTTHHSRFTSRFPPPPLFPAPQRLCASFPPSVSRFPLAVSRLPLRSLPELEH
jgi:hypothetical protein